jgi:hypothetical protein
MQWNATLKSCDVTSSDFEIVQQQCNMMRMRPACNITFTGLHTIQRPIAACAVIDGVGLSFVSRKRSNERATPQAAL